MTKQTSPNVESEIWSAPSQPESDALWHRSSSPAPRKLGDTTFRYRNLDPNKQEIRIIRILPASAGSLIACEVLHTSLNDPRSYIAISYAWGDAEDTRIIILDGHEFPVTVSLWQALQRLRSTTVAVIVWADAVCINQRNIEERNLQIQGMTRIYSLAYEVAIWLGPTDEDSSLAMVLLQEITRCSTPILNDAVIKGMVKNPKWRSNFEALVNLFERDYWNRLWIVQEVVNAKEIRVYCGEMALPWVNFRTSVEMFGRCQTELITAFSLNGKKDPNEGISTGGHTWPAVLTRFGPGSLQTWNFELLQLLLLHRRKLCADPRDKVYGLLGILTLNERSQFPVDYNTSIREVYVDVVDYYLTKTRKLDVLCAAIHYPISQGNKNLPSWTPDWSNSSEVTPMWYMARICPFNASKNTLARFKFLQRRTILEISGLSLDEISVCGAHLGPPISRDTVIMTLFEWRLRFLRLYQNDVPAHEAFCRALCLGQESSQWTPQEWMAKVHFTLTSLLQERYSALELDSQLKHYATGSIVMSDEFRDLIIEDTLLKYLAGRRFSSTKSGLICIGSGLTAVGDIIVVPLGCSTPVILRKLKDGYRFIGDVYVDGYMYGKAIDELESGARKLQTFVLH